MNNYTIKEISKDERPMEKLMKYGVEVLSNTELLAILIGSGTKKHNAIYLADDILKNKFKHKNLLYANIEQLMEIKGIGLSKSCRIISGLELGKRLNKLEKEKSISITNPDTIAEYLYEYYRDSYVEEFIILILDTKNRIIKTKSISKGSINQTLVHPREVFRHAIVNNANSMILSHNHPSGDPTPSKQDIVLTNRLTYVGNMLGIKVLDHLIIGDNNYISLRERNLIEEKNGIY